MDNFKTRLIAEKDELMEKMIKLNTFLSTGNMTGIDSFQLTLLNIQLSAMQTYYGCLEARINNLTIKK